MSNIEIEPGSHPVSKEEQAKVLTSLVNGDMDAHLWNGGVADRIGSYQPRVIAIDSLTTYGKDADSEVDKEYKLDLWCFLPAKPSKLNDRGEIYVIAGDNLYGHPEPNTLPRLYLRYLTVAGFAYAGWKGATTGYDACRPEITEETMGAIYDWEVEERNKEAISDEYMRLTRRRFFGGMAAIVGYCMYSSNELAASSPFGFAKDGLSAVNDKTGELTFERVVDVDDGLKYVDGRTALLISKMRDTLSFLKLNDEETAGAVVLGSGHLPKALDLRDDPRLRDEYIRQHTNLMVEQARKDTNYFSDRSTPAQRANNIVKKQRRVEVYRVTDPDPDTPASEVLNEISRAITLTHSFNSPSVVAATEGVLKIPRR